MTTVAQGYSAITRSGVTTLFDLIKSEISTEAQTTALFEGDLNLCAIPPDPALAEAAKIVVRQIER